MQCDGLNLRKPLLILKHIVPGFKQIVSRIKHKPHRVTQIHSMLTQRHSRGKHIVRRVKQIVSRFKHKPRRVTQIHSGLTQRHSRGKHIVSRVKHKPCMVNQMLCMIKQMMLHTNQNIIKTFHHFSGNNKLV